MCKYTNLLKIGSRTEPRRTFSDSGDLKTDISATNVISSNFSYRPPKILMHGIVKNLNKLWSASFKTRFQSKYNYIPHYRKFKVYLNIFFIL